MKQKYETLEKTRGKKSNREQLNARKEDPGQFNANKLVRLIKKDSFPPHISKRKLALKLYQETGFSNTLVES